MTKTDPEYRETVVTYYLDNHTARETIAEFHIHNLTLKQWVEDAGHEMRKRGLKRESTMRVHRDAAVKKTKPEPKPKVHPVDTSKLPPEIKRLLPSDVDRIQILNATTVIVWNSAGQRRKLQTKAAKDHRA